MRHLSPGLLWDLRKGEEASGWSSGPRRLWRAAAPGALRGRPLRGRGGAADFTGGVVFQFTFHGIISLGAQSGGLCSCDRPKRPGTWRRK